MVGAVSELAPSAPRMLPSITDRNRHFWTGGSDGALLILRCQDCRRWIHPPQGTCPGCGGTNVAAERTTGLGTVFTYTVNRHPYNPGVPGPYVIAIVELEEQPGLRFTTNIVNVDPEMVDVGMPVQVAFERYDDIFVPVFEPRDAAQRTESAGP
jgi:uncharacterized OB-fold protein